MDNNSKPQLRMALRDQARFENVVGMRDVKKFVGVADHDLAKRKEHRSESIVVTSEIVRQRDFLAYEQPISARVDNRRNPRQRRFAPPYRNGIPLPQRDAVAY